MNHAPQTKIINEKSAGWVCCGSWTGSSDQSTNIKPWRRAPSGSTSRRRRYSMMGQSPRVIFSPVHKPESWRWCVATSRRAWWATKMLKDLQSRSRGRAAGTAAGTADRSADDGASHPRCLRCL